MQDFLTYDLKAGACLAVFYLFYKVLLSRETFHRFNRVLLLSAIVGSFLLPLCTITVYREVPRPEVLPLAELLDTAAVFEPAAAESGPSLRELAVQGLFLAGAVAAALWTAVSLCRVVRLIRTGRRVPVDARAELVLHERELTPFSWMRYIVLSERDNRESGCEIVAHERAHIRLGHSFDLLVTDLLSCLQWFNPAMWLLRGELRAIHEYEADEAVLRGGVDARRYQMLLVKKAAGERWYSVANSFNHSKLKNRITMMLRKRSSRWAGARALFVLPLAGAALGAFAETVYLYPEDKDSRKTVNIQTQTLSAQSEASRTASAPAVRTKKEPCKVNIFVYDRATKEPLVGVIVVPEGSKQGTVTDPAGKAVLEVADGTVLTFKMVGYQSMQLKASGLVDGAALRVGLPKEDATGSHADIVILGGVSTRHADDPLFIVDGELADDLNAIDADRIASIDVLKDAASIESYVKRYGDKARKGIVVVKLRSEQEQVASAAAGVTSAALQAGREGIKAARAGLEVARGQISEKEYREAVVEVDRAEKELAEIAAENGLSGKMSSVTVSSAAPIYIVDGERLPDGKSINDILPDQIVSMEIRKDRTAVDEYGAAPGQGVIIVRTKSETQAESHRSTIPGVYVIPGVSSLSGDKVNVSFDGKVIRIIGNLDRFGTVDAKIDRYEIDGRPADGAEVRSLNVRKIKKIEISEEDAGRTMRIRTRASRRKS